MNKQWIRLAGGVATVALLAVGCSMSPSMTHAMPGSMAGTATSATKAADLRTGLNALLGEHVYLASAATNAALGGRQAEFEAAASALDANSVDIAKAIGSVYGADAEKAFLPLWRRHIGFFVDYTVGVATKDKSKQGKAVADLVKTHVLTLRDVVDAQAAGDPVKANKALRTAYSHMHMIADPLAEAIVKQFSNKYAAQ